MRKHAAQLMRGGPSESGNRPWFQTARSCARVTARVVSIRGKGGHRARQVTPQKTNASKPPIRCRNRIVDAIETGLLSRAEDEVDGAPVFFLDGGRHVGGLRWERGDCAERGNLALGCQWRIARGQKAPSSERVPMPSAGTDPPVVCAAQRTPRSEGEGHFGVARLAQGGRSPTLERTFYQRE